MRGRVAFTSRMVSVPPRTRQRRAITLIYNQNGNADWRVNEQARFKINETV